MDSSVKHEKRIYNTAVGAIIEHLVKCSGKTRRDFFVTAGMSESTFSRVLAGTSELRSGDMFAFCRFVGINPIEFDAAARALSQDPVYRSQLASLWTTEEALLASYLQVVEKLTTSETSKP